MGDTINVKGNMLTLCRGYVLLLLLSKTIVPNISFKTGKKVKLPSPFMCCYVLICRGAYFMISKLNLIIEAKKKVCILICANVIHMFLFFTYCLNLEKP